MVSLSDFSVSETVQASDENRLLLFGQVEFAETLQGTQRGSVGICTVRVLVAGHSVSDSESQVGSGSVGESGDGHIVSFVLLVEEASEVDHHVMESVSTESAKGKKENRVVHGSVSVLLV